MKTESPAALKRVITFPLLIFYGLGTIIGAGIYILVGKIAHEAGDFTLYSIAIAGTLALLTALSYAELSSKFPQSAGAALYVHKAWNTPILSGTMGYGLALTGIVSSATITNGCIGYLNVFLPDANNTLAIILIVIAMTALIVYGIKESLTVIAIITIIEIGGLFLVISIAATGEIDYQSVNNLFTLPTTMPNINGILLGSFIAFYAFLGFEDMVNVAEETKSPAKTMPRAVIGSVLIAIVLYIAVSIAATASMPLEQLANSKAPLSDIVTSNGYSPHLITAISLIAVINGALVNMIMSSRILYGMANQGLAPKTLARVNVKTKTPINASIIVALFVLAFTLGLDLTSLATLTSFLTMTVFVFVNAALVKIKCTKTQKEADTLDLPIILPIIAAAASLIFLIWRLVQIVI